MDNGKPQVESILPYREIGECFLLFAEAIAKDNERFEKLVDAIEVRLMERAADRLIAAAQMKPLFSQDI